MQRSARHVLVDVWMSGRNAASRRVNRVMQPLGPHLSAVGGDCSLEQRAAAPRTHEHPHQVCDGDDGKGGDFEGSHGRFLIVVIAGRIGSLARRIAARCEVSHTRARNAVMRGLRDAWASLVADKVRGRGYGYWRR